MEFLYSAFADESSSDFFAQIDALKRTGCQYLEIRGLTGGNFTTLTDAEAKDIRKALEDNGLKVWSLGSPIGKIPVDGDWEEHLEKYKRVLELADLMDTKRIRLFSFFMPKGEDPVNYRNVVIDRMGVFAELAKKAGVIACHENEKGIYGDIAERNADVLHVFPELGFAFDPANFIQCGVNTLEAYELLHERITYMHIKDAIMADGAVVSAGNGDGNVAEILRRLNAERDGEIILTVEPHLTVFKGLNDLQDEELKHHESYPDSRTAFHAAVSAIKGIIEKI